VSASDAAIRFLDAVASQATDRLAQILEEDVHVEFPYDEGERANKFDGRDAVVEYFDAAFEYLEPIEFSDVIGHQGPDPHTAVVEFRGTSRWVADGRPYRQRYIAVVATDDDDRIVLYREYRNPTAY